jgi:hypothetical protein
VSPQLTLSFGILFLGVLLIACASEPRPTPLAAATRQVATALPLPTATVEPSSTPRVIPLGQPFKKETAAEVYLLDAGHKRVVRDPAAFGFAPDAIWILPDAQVDALADGDGLNLLIKGNGVPVYKMEHGSKRRIPNLPTLERLGYQLTDVSIVSQDLFEFFPVGADLSAP